MPGRPRHRVAVEVAVQDTEGTVTALAAGATRVELCSALDLGGLTPSLGAVEAAVTAAAAAVTAPSTSRNGVHVLVRPRPGGFVLGPGDVDVIRRDAALAVRAGAAGVVVGGLTAAGELDEDLVLAVLDAVRGEAADGAVTFHRAVDAAADPGRTVRRLAELGVDRVLTSGGATDAVSGADNVARLVQAAQDQLAVMAGGGLRPEVLADLLVRTGVLDVHLSARHVVARDTGFGAVHSTDADMVRAAVAATLDRADHPCDEQ